MRIAAKEVLLTCCEMIKEKIEKEDLEATKELVEDLFQTIIKVQRLKD